MADQAPDPNVPGASAPGPHDNPALPRRLAAVPGRLSLGEHLAIVSRHWPLLLILPLALGSLAYAWLGYNGRTYAAAATVMVYPVESDLPGAPPDVLAAIMLARTYGALAVSPDVLSGTAFALGLPESAATLGPRVTSRAEPESQLVVISVEDRDPARAAALANAVSTTFIRWISDRNAAMGTAPIRLALVGPADVPVQPKGQPTATTIAVAAALGLLVGVLLAYAVDRLDRRIWSARDVRRAVDLPVAARMPGPRALWPRSRLVTLGSPLARSSDAFRSLWLRLGLGAPEQTVHAIVVTSAGAARGSSAIAANLAISIAQSGQRVVLVDANLRAPRMDRLFKLPGRAGLSNLLAGAGGWISDHLVDGPVPELKLMLVGSLPRQEREQFAVRPLELATAIELLIAALHASGDLVVVDAPPLLDASEALVFAALATKLVVVVQEGQTRPVELVQALDDLGAMSERASLVLAGGGW